MKRCPQCNSVFTDENTYCLNDGTILEEENLSLPSQAEIGEEPTVIRTEPMIVDIAPEIPPTMQFQQPAQETIILHRPSEEKTKSKTPKYVLFMLLGLLIGGGLVLGAFLLAGRFYQNSNVDVVYANVDSKVNSKPDKTETPNKEVSENTDIFGDENSGEYNGRVIAVNANLRSEPGLYSEEIAVLPIDERINIIRREDDYSPWYYVETENGESGWMHGNTIEFTK